MNSLGNAESGKYARRKDTIFAWATNDGSSSPGDITAGKRLSADYEISGRVGAKRHGIIAN